MHAWDSHCGHLIGNGFPRLFAAAALCVLANTASAQRPDVGEIPAWGETFALADPRVEPAAKSPPVLPSFEYGVTVVGVPEVGLGPVDVAALAEEDAARAPVDRRLRDGVVRDVSVKPDNGRWFDIPGIGRLWVADIVATGAEGVRLHLTGMNLPRDGRLFVYPPSAPDEAAGPFEARGILGDGQFWTPTILGDRVRIEYFVPATFRGDPNAPAFRIDRLLHIYRDAFGRIGPQPRGPCRIDVTCDSTWAFVAAGVARISYVSGPFSYRCTGELLNTNAGDLTPYFLTANHCINTNAEAQSAQLFWFYQTATCNGAPPSLGSVPTSSVCTLLAHGSATDYSLLMVDGELPTGVTWIGWTPDPISNTTAATCVHHPAGDYKRIAYGAKSSQNSTHHWIDWASGGTEGGSSGSAIFRNAGQQVIGQLTGNVPNCHFQDNYGRFDVTYPNISGLLAGGSDDNLEDNDACATARAVTQGSYPNLIVKSTDEDWYRVTVAAGNTLDLDLFFTHDFGDIDVRLFDTCGGSLLALGNSTTNNESISYQNPGPTADFLLRVYLYSDTRNGYDMVVTETEHCFNCPNFDSPIWPADTYSTISDSFTAGGCRWYRVWMTQNSQYRLTVCEGGGSHLGDTVFTLYDGACSQVGFNDDTCGLGSQLDYTAPASDYYYLKVSEFANNDPLSYTLAYRRIPGPCTACPSFDFGPFAPTQSPATHSGAILGGGCNQYLLNLAADCEYTFTFCADGGTADYDTYLTLRDAGCNAVAGNDDACGLLSEVVYTPTVTGSYYLEVNSCCTGGSGGSYTLAYRQSSSPPHDECVNAVPITEGVPYNGSTACADGADITTCTFNDIIDVWHVWTAPCDMDVKISLCGSAYDTALAVFDACGGNELACNDDNFPACGPGNHSQIDSFPATGGMNYLIRVSGFNGQFGDYTLLIAPANDDCDDATPVGDGATLFCNVGASTDGPDEPAHCDNAGDTHIQSDIWYRYTATCDGDVTVSLCGSAYDTKLGVYGSTCPTGPGQIIACNDDAGPPSACAGALQSELTFTTTAGSRHLIRIGGYFGAQGPGTLTIACTPSLGDMNCDGVVDLNDIGPFTLALVDPAGYAAAFPNCVILNGDFDGSGAVNGLDTNGFVAALLAP